MQPVMMRAIREAKGLNKSQLAFAAKMQPNIIGWIESGRFIPFDSQLAKIAAVLGVEDPEELMRPASYGVVEDE